MIEMHVFGKNSFIQSAFSLVKYFYHEECTLSIIMLLKHCNRSKHFPFFLISCFVFSRLVQSCLSPTPDQIYKTEL